MALNNVGSYQPSLQQAVNLTGAGGAPIGFSPLTGGDIQQYMNPYQGQVIGALESAANTNLFQNVLPSVQDRFTSAGQSRSPQEMQATNNAVYQSNQALDQAIGNSLQTGYQGALQTAQQQQGAGLQVEQGNRAAAQTAGAQFGQLGALQQQLGASDVGEVAAAGQAQDINNQANINAGLNNFYAQQQWPYQNLAFASNIIRGQPVASNTQTVGQQYNPGQSYTSSPLASFVGTTLGASALSNNANTSALGLRKGGSVDPSALRKAASLGRGNDTELAHVSPREGALLRAMGGSGAINPRTGLREFDDSGGSSGANAGDSNAGYVGQFSQIPTYDPTLTISGATQGDKAMYGPLMGSYGSDQFRGGATLPAGAMPIDPALLNAAASRMTSIASDKGGGETVPFLSGQQQWIATPNNPLYTTNSQGYADFTPAGQSAFNDYVNNAAQSIAQNAKKNASGLSGYLSTPAGGLSMLALPIGVGLAAPALAGALGATAGAAGAAGGAGAAGDAAGANLISDLASGSGGLAATTPEAGAATAGGSQGALSSLFSPLNVARAAETAGRLISGSPTAAASESSAAAAPSIATTAATPTTYAYNNPAFYASSPNSSFYAARGGKVPAKGALTRRLQRAA